MAVEELFGKEAGGYLPSRGECSGTSSVTLTLSVPGVTRSTTIVLVVEFVSNSRI